MSVILTEKIPENCKKCPLSYRNDYFLQNPPLQCNFVYAPFGLAENERHKDCILKSVDGLIKFIIKHSYPVRYDKNSIEQGMTITGVEQAIKEYCGMEENER